MIFVIAAGINVNDHDIRFVEDNWESPVRLCINFHVSFVLYIDASLGKFGEYLICYILRLTVAFDLLVGIRCLGIGLGNLDGWYGDYSIHLLPAGPFVFQF